MRCCREDWWAGVVCAESRLHPSGPTSQNHQVLPRSFDWEHLSYNFLSFLGCNKSRGVPESVLCSFQCPVTEIVSAKMWFENYSPWSKSTFNLNFIFSFLRISRSHLTKLGKIMRRSCKCVFFIVVVVVFVVVTVLSVLRKRITKIRTESWTNSFRRKTLPGQSL